MDMRRFSAENRARCEALNGFNHTLESWSLSDWMTATLGELGEAANVAKKLNRVRDGIPGNKESADDLRAKLAAEIGDAFIYLDLMAQSQGIDLAVAVAAAFDAKSKQIGYVPGPKVRACNHVFAGWREFNDGNGGEQFCQRCGLGAMQHTLSYAP